MWQIPYPPAKGASQGNYFLPKMGFQPKTRKYAVFFFQLNVLPPYSLFLQGDKLFGGGWETSIFKDRAVQKIPTCQTKFHKFLKCKAIFPWFRTKKVNKEYFCPHLKWPLCFLANLNPIFKREKVLRKLISTEDFFFSLSLSLSLLLQNFSQGDFFLLTTESIKKLFLSSAKS